MRDNDGDVLWYVLDVKQLRDSPFKGVSLIIIIQIVRPPMGGKAAAGTTVSRLQGRVKGGSKKGSRNYAPY